MKRVYVAGLYSADNVMDVLRNIRRGIEAATEVLKAGYAPFCPWLDYHFVLFDSNDELPKQAFYDYSMAFVEVCHAMLVISNAEGSGVNAEIDRAKELGIPIVHTLSELRDILHGES